MSKQIIVVIDAGHGFGKTHNRGAVCFNEGDNNYNYSLVLKKELERFKGIVVRLTRPKITDNPSLAERGKIAQGADLLISAHSNAFKLSTANGVVILDSVRRPNIALASKLVNGISELFASLNRGVQYKEGQKGWDWYGVLRNSRAKSSMIIEYGFHTNSKDCNYFKNNHNIIAQKTASIVAEHYLGSKGQKPAESVGGGSGLIFYNRRVNNRGVGVEQLQKDLKALGYTISVDGSFGPATEEVVKQFQIENNLQIDGSAGTETLRTIKKLLDEKNKPKDYLSLGDGGQKVTKLQTDLKNLGYDILIRGGFGKQVLEVVKQFQKDNNLKVDGFVGSETQKTIKRLLLEKEKDIYVVYAGHYKEKENADLQVKRLKNYGFDSFVGKK